MANHKANQIRVQMKVPITFRDALLKSAHSAGMTGTVYLENVKLIYARDENVKTE